MTKTEIESVTKADLHQLVDQLPGHVLKLARRLLQALSEEEDRFLKGLESAPEEDEPVSPEEAAAIDEAWEDVRAGRVHSLEDVKRELGLG